MVHENAPQQVVNTDSGTDYSLATELSELSYVTYLDDVQLSDGLQSGSIAGAMIFACSDMGWQLPYVCSAPASNLFVFQTFGRRFAEGGAAEAMTCADVSDVIIYGHTDCQFMKFLARDEHDAAEKELIARHFQPEHSLQMKEFALQTESGIHAPWLEICRRRVLGEIASMLSHSAIADRARAGTLRFHAWLHESEKNALEVFDPSQEAFVSPQLNIFMSETA